MAAPKWRAGTTTEEPWILHDEVPEYQAGSDGCPMCHRELHYSSGWDRRICDICGYIEGMTGCRYYPIPLSFSDYHTLAGQFYYARTQRWMDGSEFEHLVWAYTTYGSFYRPWFEDD
jgi:hypothetical protein